MAATAYLRLGSHFIAAPIGGSVDVQDFALEDELAVAASSDTIARILCEPGDYAGGGTNPYIEFILYNGTDPETITVNAVPSSGATEINATIRANVAGANDFTNVRAIHIRAFPDDPNSASEIKGDLVLGDLSTASAQRACLPIGYDSASTDSTAGTAAFCAVPTSLQYSESEPLVLRIYVALNVKVLITLLGN